MTTVESSVQGARGSALTTGCAALACLLLASTAPMAGLDGLKPAPQGHIVATAAPAAATDRAQLIMRDHEPLAAALARAGLGADQTAAAVAALADDFDTANAHPGLLLMLQTASPPASAGGPRLISLALSPNADVSLRLWRAADGALRLDRTESPVVVTQSLIHGRVSGSLYLSLVAAGAQPEMAAKVAGLFGRRLDLGRDIDDGAQFRLVLDQRRRSDQGDAGPPELLYADLEARQGKARLYRATADDAADAADAQYVDGDAVSRPAPMLLRTPVVGARISSGFGLRLHPILGFTRMHQGVDFAAPSGSPVLAAGDGVVEAARWAGGYGRWLKIRHADGVETAYGHLSGWAAAIGPGVSVHQGQVVGYVGDSGLATGPHLHFEVFEAGQRVNPQTASLAQSAVSRRGEDLGLRARKADIDALVAGLALACQGVSAPDPDRAAACGG